MQVAWVWPEDGQERKGEETREEGDIWNKLPACVLVRFRRDCLAVNGAVLHGVRETRQSPTPKVVPGAALPWLELGRVGGYKGCGTGDMFASNQEVFLHSPLLCYVTETWSRHSHSWMHLLTP